jgi:AAA ATPase domain
LYGRERDLGVLNDLTDRLGEGGGGALVVRGEAGTGESALLATVSSSATDKGVLVVAATGVQSEMHVPFAGLRQLLQPLLVRIDELPVPQHDALKAAFGMTESAAPELFLIALATLELLADAAARAPVLVIAEDAQWLDYPSCDVSLWGVLTEGL